jgi:ABC-type antimicrobial peptide transport system permease subunit
VIAFTVTQRTHEIGIRMALGAERGEVLQMVMRQGMALVAGGLVLGLGGAWAVTRVMAGMLHGVSATDPMSFAGMSLVLIAVAAFATVIPARRAARIDPMIALRTE